MVYIGADHGGYELKEKMHTWLEEWGIAYEDVGAHEFVETDDYPDFAFAVADAVAQSPEEHLGVVACRSAAGVIIAANKVHGVRAVAAFNEESAHHSREHNNANVLGLSGDWLTDDEAKTMLHTWLTTAFPGEERHVRRIEKIAERDN